MSEYRVFATYREGMKDKVLGIVDSSRGDELSNVYNKEK